MTPYCDQQLLDKAEEAWGAAIALSHTGIHTEHSPARKRQF